MATETGHVPWLVLVVDDEDSMREMIRIWLRDLTYQGRPVEVLEATSKLEALQVLRRTPEVAVVLLDQVLEGPNDGIETALYIRRTLGLRETRVILNTALDQALPKLDVLQREEVNDIQYKNELSLQKLQALVITNLRNYRDLINLRVSEALSTRLMQVNNRLQVAETEEELIGSILSSIHHICASIPPRPPRPNPHVLLLREERRGEEAHLVLLNGSGLFERSQGELFLYHLDEVRRHEVFTAVSERRPVWQKDFFLFPFETSDGTCLAVGAVGDEDWDIYTLNSLRLFVSRIPAILDRIKLIDRLKQRQEELQRALQEREVLLREVHHRVKNNLQIISSLLAMDGNVERIQDRIYSMALVHDQLYHMQRFSEVDLVYYLGTLCADLAQMLQLGNRLVLESASNELSIPYDRAIPVGLVVNELVVNAAKHALAPGDTSRIFVRILSCAPLIIRVEDEGPGLTQAEAGTGLKLIRMLLDQLKGELRAFYQNGQKMEVYIP